MEPLFVRVFGGSPTFWLTGGDVLNEQQRTCDAIGFNKNATAGFTIFPSFVALVHKKTYLDMYQGSTTPSIYLPKVYDI